MFAIVFGDPVAFIVIGLVLTHYLNGYVALVVIALLFDNSLAFTFYAPLTEVVESAWRVVLRRALLLLLLAGIAVAMVWPTLF